MQQQTEFKLVIPEGHQMSMCYSLRLLCRVIVREKK